MTRKRVKPSDFRAEAERLVRAGKMPSLSQLVEAIREVKQNPEYNPPVLNFDTDAIRKRKGGQQ